MTGAVKPIGVFWIVVDAGVVSMVEKGKKVVVVAGGVANGKSIHKDTGKVCQGGRADRPFNVPEDVHVVKMGADMWAAPKAAQSSVVEIEMDEGCRCHSNLRQFDVRLAVEVIVCSKPGERSEID